MAVTGRIEDLDIARCPQRYGEQMCRDIQWLGLDWDEGPVIGGPSGPYEQSRRTALYAFFPAGWLSCHSLTVCSAVPLPFGLPSFTSSPNCFFKAFIVFITYMVFLLSVIPLICWYRNLCVVLYPFPACYR